MFSSFLSFSTLCQKLPAYFRLEEGYCSERTHKSKDLKGNPHLNWISDCSCVAECSSCAIRRVPRWLGTSYFGIVIAQYVKGHKLRLFNVHRTWTSNGRKQTKQNKGRHASDFTTAASKRKKPSTDLSHCAGWPINWVYTFCSPVKLLRCRCRYWCPPLRSACAAAHLPVPFRSAWESAKEVEQVR